MRKLLTLGLAAALAVTQLNLGLLSPAVKVEAETIDTQTTGTALTPPMGWNSWNKYGANINESLIKGMADAMVASGMKDAGYEYINLDDGWMTTEYDQNGVPAIDYNKFPNGIKAVADYVHSKGLKLGIYLSNGTKTCQGLASSLLHEDATAQAFADWGVDYFKYDWCYNYEVSQYAPNIDKIDVSKDNFTSSYEAEAADNTLEGEAKVADSTGASNGKVVSYIGNNSGVLTFNKVNVPADGTYTLKVSYFNGDLNRRVAYIGANSAQAAKYLFSGTNGDWNTVQTQELSVALKQGDNTIKIYNPMSTGQDRGKEQYSWMSDALIKAGRPIVFSLCEWGSNQPWLGWGKEVGQLWRTTGDISDNWSSMVSITDQNAELAQYAGPNGWNDPDMLEVGNGGMTTTEYRSHFSLWCEMAAPLITGNDLANMTDATKEILLNKEVIAVDQDSLGKQGVKVHDYGDQEVFAKPLANGDVAVVLFNRGSAGTIISTTPEEIGIGTSPAYKLRDLWSHTDMLTAGTISASVPSHGVVMYRVSKAQGNEEIAPYMTMSFTGDTMIEQGKSGKLTAMVTNNGYVDVSNVSINLTGPTGWEFNAAAPVTFDKLSAGQSQKAEWTLTVPVDAQIGVSSIKGCLSYTYGNNQNSSLNVETSVTVPAQAPNEDAYLSDLTWTSSTVGWSTAKKDKSIDGNGITIGGVSYDKGLGLHAQAETLYYLGGNYSKFTAAVGIDSEVGNRGSVEFQVFGDGTMLYESGVVRGGEAAKAADVDIAGVKMLKLVVTNGGDDINYDHADWANAFIQANPKEVKLAGFNSDNIDAGASGNVTAELTNISSAALKDFSAGLVLPKGWTAEAQSPVTFESVEAGQTVTIAWKLTRPADYESSGTTGVKLVADYKYSQENISGEFSKVVQVVTYPIPPKQDCYLSDINWLSTTNAWGPVERNESNGEQGTGDGSTITINGVKYEKGLGVHAVSEIEYYIAGKFNRFTANVGIDDEVIGKGGTPTSIIFQVWGDGNKLWESQPMAMQQDAIPVDVDITGVKVLKLVATNGVDGINNDHGDWANAMIKMDRTAPTIEVNGIKDGDAVKLNQEVTVNWTATDDMTGVASASGDITSGSKLDTSKIGPHTLTFTATDKVGNTSTKTIIYYVQYVYGNVLSPITIDSTRTFKLGSTIPVKFQLKDAKGNYVDYASAKLYVSKVGDIAGEGEALAVSTSAASTGNEFRYDNADNQYIFNLNTKGLSSGTYQIRIDLGDGTTNTVNIALR